MSVIKLLLSLIALANNLAGAIRDTVLRKRVWKEYQNDRLATETARLRRAYRARMARRNADRSNPDKRMQDDGFRRD